MMASCTRNGVDDEQIVATVQYGCEWKSNHRYYMEEVTEI